MPTVIFDLGIVLASESSQTADAARLLGTDRAATALAYWAHRDAWDLGGSDLDYWGAVAGQLGVAIDEELAARLTVQDGRLWTTIRPAARQLLVEVKEQGHPLWLLSNAAASFDESIRESDWGHLLDGHFVSGVLGMVKPEARIFEHVEATLGIPAGQIVFVDDRQDNVDAALARGWQAHLWRSDEDNRAWLTGLGILG